MEEQEMRFNKTETEVEIWSEYLGIDSADNMCFECIDRQVLPILEDLLWCDRVARFPIDPLRPLQVGDKVRVVYSRSKNRTPRHRWVPIDWVV